tara:strand:+ start:179 stop:379 length:201 start_codon:yes stop_codon:yes gene_type:complete
MKKEEKKWLQPLKKEEDRKKDINEKDHDQIAQDQLKTRNVRKQINYPPNYVNGVKAGAMIGAKMAE